MTKKKNNCHHCYIESLSKQDQISQSIVDELDRVLGKVMFLVKVNEDRELKHSKDFQAILNVLQADINAQISKLSPRK